MRNLSLSDGLLSIEGLKVINKNMIKLAWRKLLYLSLDGCSLKESASCASAHRWISDGSALMSGREFITDLHVRIGVLYSKSRALRDRETKSKQCGRGCSLPETLNHILQQCFYTHFTRVTRNDELAKYFKKLCLDRGRTLHYEPIFETIDNCKLKPDLVIYEESCVSVVDIQVINAQFALNMAHAN